MNVDNGMTVDKPKPFYNTAEDRHLFFETCDICDRKPYEEIDNVKYCQQCYTEAINDRFIKEIG